MEMHECLLSPAAADNLVLKNQAISIHNADSNINCKGPLTYKNISYTEHY